VEAWSPTTEPLPTFMGAHLAWEDAYATVTLSQGYHRNAEWFGRELVLGFSHAPLAQIWREGIGPATGIGAFIITDSDWLAAAPSWVWLEGPLHFRFCTEQATIDVGSSFAPELTWRDMSKPDDLQS